MGCTNLIFKSQCFKALAMTDSQVVISVLWGHRPSPTEVSWSPPGSIPCHHTPKSHFPLNQGIGGVCFGAKIKAKEGEKTHVPIPQSR